MCRRGDRSIRGSPPLPPPARASPRRWPDARSRHAQRHFFATWTCRKASYRKFRVRVSLVSRRRLQEGEMTRTRTITLAVFIVLTASLFAETATKHRPATNDSFHVSFSGSFSYSVGGGKARMTIQDIQNTGTATSGPLHIILVFTPNAPFPAVGFAFTAQYDLGPLAP